MKQVNMWIPDDVYVLLVKEAARRMIAAGKEIPISRLAADLVIESVTNSDPDRAQGENPKIESNEDNKDGEQSKGAFDFSALDI